MKNLMMLFALVLIVATKSNAQKSMVKFQVGYGLPLSQSTIINLGQTVNSTTTITALSGSYGGGLQLEAGYIYSFSDALSFQFDAAFLQGKKINVTLPVGTGSVLNSYYAHFGELAPMIRINGKEGKLKPYMAVGPLIGFGNTFAQSTFASSSSSVSESVRKYSGSLTFGAKSIVGVEFKANKFSYYIQATMINMSFSPTKSEITKDVQNGVDVSGNLTVAQKQTVYQSSYSYNSSNPINQNQPTTSLKFYQSFSSLSLNAGVMFRL